MRIGGFLKQSLIDYPGKICSVVFTIGCNFRCPYCHNSDLVLPGRAIQIPEKEVLDYLQKNRRFIDAVTITGGETTVQPDLEEFTRKLKKFGFLVKLDTNGTSPETVEKLITSGLVDYVAMDVKAPLDVEKQNKSTGGRVNEEILEKMKKTINLLKKAKIKHEFRTTVVPTIHTPDDIALICKQLQGEQTYTLQQFRPRKTLDPSFMNIKPYKQEDLQKMKEACEKYIPNVVIKAP